MSVLTFRDKYKKDNENIQPSEKTINDLAEKLKGKDDYKMKTQRKFNSRLALAAFIALSIFTGMAFNRDKLDQKDSLVNNKGTIVEGNNASNPTKDGYYIPEIQIAKNDSNALACRIATIVYKGRVYTMGSNNITLEEGKALMGEKLGVTWNFSNYIEDDGTSAGYIDLEKLDDFATFGEGEEVYTVKGYNEGFRLITYSNNEYGESISMWECLNGINLNNGKDVFGQMNIKDNISSLKWDTFNNWNNGTPNPMELAVDGTLNAFIEAIYNSTPSSMENEEIDNLFLYQEDPNLSPEESKQKFMYLKLKDGTSVEFRLFSDGYIYYSGLNGFVFKVDDTAFNNMWDYLK